MYVFEGEDASELVVNMLKELVEKGNEYTSRNGNMKELRPVTAILNNPKRRCIFLPKRKNNIFATVAELAWFFSGKHRIDDFLVKFLPRATDFSDDGATWRGAYGPRLRYWSKINDEGSFFHSKPINQIEYVIDILKNSPDSRRAFINIYDPIRDSKPGKDIPCFIGDTVICSPYGNMSIEELYRRSQNKKKKQKKFKYPVYSANIQTGAIEINWARNIRITKEQTKVIRISFDDGSDIVCTENHKIYIKNKKRILEVEAGMLRPGYSVIPLHVIEDGKGYKHFINTFIGNSSYRNKYKVHRAVVEFIEKRKLNAGVVVHHKDENKSNNRYMNLEPMTHEEHNILERGVYNPKDKSMFSNDDLIEIGVIAVKDYGKLTRDSFNKTTEKTGNDVKYYTVRKRFGSFSDFRLLVDEKITNNHKIISIDIVKGKYPVYNMTVDNNHNYFVGSGVLVGNCNTSLDFKLRDNKLDLTVFNRSNDIIWGFSGVNLFIFTYLQEVIANTLNVELGKYYHISNSMHLYENMYKRADLILKNYSKWNFYDEYNYNFVARGVDDYDKTVEYSEYVIKMYNGGGHINIEYSFISSIIHSYMLYEELMYLYKSYNNNSKEISVLNGIKKFVESLEHVSFDVRMCVLNYVVRQVKSYKDDVFNDNLINIIGNKWLNYVKNVDSYGYIFRG